MTINPSWAQEELTYTVNIVDRSRPGYPYQDQKIMVEANFIAGSTLKQQLHMVESGLDEMQLQAQLFVDDIKQGDEVIEDNSKIQYQGVCHNPITQQANVIFYTSGNAASVDTSDLIALQFDKNTQQMQVVSATEGPYYFGDDFELLSCEVGQKFSPEAGTFKPCSCDIKSPLLNEGVEEEITLG